MKIGLPLVVSSALLLSLPAAAQPLPVNCSGSCTVVITMSAGCGSGIKVAPDPVVVAAGATADITWSIESPGWAFDSNGIFVHQPGEAFEKAPGSSKTFKFKNRNKGPRAYKYDVNLVSSTDQSKCKLDPVIINQ